MKKLIAGIFFVVLLLILATSVAMADQPDGVDSSFRQRAYCSYGNQQGQPLYGGYGFRLFPNSASGHWTTKCKMEHKNGPLIFGTEEHVLPDGCSVRIVFAGKTALYLKQGFNCETEQSRLGINGAPLAVFVAAGLIEIMKPGC